MKVLKNVIASALVYSAVVLALAVIALLLLLFCLATPAAVLNWQTGKDLSRVLAQWCTAVGSITLLPGVVGWVIFFATKDSIGSGKKRKDVQ
jgi:hypothetical protein